MRGWPVLVVIALALAGCASHQAGTQAGTVARTFHAYSPSGELTVQVADISAGTCWTTSIAAPASGAYRCLSNNSIFDPCFAPARPSAPIQLACLPDPWSNAHVLRVPRLPTGPGHGKIRPWAFELANGVRCVAASGTVPAVEGVDMGYHCRNGGDAALLDTSVATVHARYAAPGARTLQTVVVATIWRA